MRNSICKNRKQYLELQHGFSLIGLQHEAEGPDPSVGIICLFSIALWRHSRQELPFPLDLLLLHCAHYQNSQWDSGESDASTG